MYLYSLSKLCVAMKSCTFLSFCCKYFKQKNKTCYLVYTHQHWLKEKTCAMFKKNLEIYKYMKSYVDKGGILEQLNKRSVLFFKCVASLTLRVWLRSENTARQTSTPEQFHYSPLALLLRGKYFHQMVFIQACD